jgi:hypothetical protein
MAVTAAVQAAPWSGAHNRLVTAGVAVRVAATGHWLGASVGALLPTATTTLELGVARASQLRIPFDASARIIWRRGDVEGTADLGLVASYLRVEGEDLYRARILRRIEMGVRAGIGVLLGSWRVAPWLAATAEAIPVPYDLAFAPAGVVGRTSPFWIGAMAGLSARFW